MKVLSFTLAAVLSLATQAFAATANPAVPAPATQPAQQAVTIPGGTALKVQVADKVSSSNANVGDTFAVKALDDVVVGGYIVIAKGASGQGEVLAVDHAGGHGHPGSLSLQMDWIFAVDGEKVKLSSQRQTAEGENKAGAASTMTVVSSLFLGLPGLFAHNMVHGRDIDIDASHPLDAFVADTVHVMASTKATATGFAH